MQAQMEAISSSICTNTPPHPRQLIGHGFHDLGAGSDGIAGEEADTGIQSAQCAGTVALDQQATLIDFLAKQVAVPEFHLCSRV